MCDMLKHISAVAQIWKGDNVVRNQYIAEVIKV